MIAAVVVMAALFAPTVADAQRAAAPAPVPSPIASATPESVGMSAARLTRLTTDFTKEIDDKRLPGAVMMVAPNASRDYRA